MSDLLRELDSGQKIEDISLWDLPPTQVHQGGAVKVWDLSEDHLPRSLKHRVNTKEWPNEPHAAVRLVDVLEQADGLPSRYFLSQKACAGILRRAEKRDTKLPAAFERIMRLVAGKNEV